MSPDSGFAIEPPIEPMLAKIADELPDGEDVLYEPKWDGFRAIVFRSASDVYIQSRDLRPFDRYFPDLHAVFAARLPPGCVLDGEIVIATAKGLDFDALQLRLHPAASRVAKLAQEQPAGFVAFDLLAADGTDLRERPLDERRERLERLLGASAPPLYLTPMTRDRGLAAEWLDRFEGAGLDGVIAKPAHGRYEPGKRAMLKIKHARTADCVVAGFRWHKSGPDAIGSLLLGLYDGKGRLHHVGVTSSFTMATRKQLVAELAPLRERALAEHPWREWAQAGDGTRMPGGQSRWSAGKDLSWEPLRVERVCEVKYDHLQGDRFRHGAVFQRWRPDRQPADCRYDQLEVTAPYELEKVFGAARRPR
jgi:ATP-dependent DNA ligase